jgi:diguanylate cyclase (GGDEF)-like protein/PAS domain S-box-containing protein
LRRIDLSVAENKGVAPLGYGLFIMLAITLVAGWRFAQFASDWSDDEVRDILLVQAGTATVGFTPGRLASLSGTTVDRKDENYQHLREKMQAVSLANPKLRSVHLLILRDGKILEAVSVDAKDPGRVDIGVVYERPPKELLQAFSPGNVTTLGPYRGGSGDLVSAFAPVRDPRTNAVAGVVGIDISADDWKLSVAEYRLTAIFVTLLVVLLVIYFFIVHERMWRSAQLTARSETRLAAAQRMAHIGNWSYDHWSRRITWSEEMFRIYGRDPKLGAPSDPRELKALTHPQDWPRLRSAMREAIEKGAGYQLEFRVLQPDGSLRQVEATAHASRGDNGKVVALTGTVQDISERRRAEEALRDSAAQLRLFADNVPAMAVSLDENLRYLFANKRYADFFGLDPADIVGKHLREGVGEETYREIEGHFARALQGHPVSYQRVRKLANGESRYLEVKLLPHIGDQGKVLGCFVVTTDITEHKQAEERIQRVAHHDSLTGLPNRLLFNDRLNQAISLAKRDSRQFALLYLDLDKFKAVNDTLGHTAGDELLQAVAARIRQQVRESDTVARVGGDEFTVILPGIARHEEAETVAKKIITALVAPFQLDSQKQSVDIGTSIGIALYPSDAQDADALIKAADAAMYGAKQARSGYRFFGA